MWVLLFLEIKLRLNFDYPFQDLLVLVQDRLESHLVLGSDRQERPAKFPLHHRSHSIIVLYLRFVFNLLHLFLSELAVVSMDFPEGADGLAEFLLLSCPLALVGAGSISKSLEAIEVAKIVLGFYFDFALFLAWALTHSYSSLLN